MICSTRLVEPSSGRVILNTEASTTDLARLSVRSLWYARRQVTMEFQEYHLFERLTVMENVLTGRLGYTPAWKTWLRWFEAEDIERAYQLLDKLGLSHLSDQRAGALSGGRRVGIARALIQKPNLLLADERTSLLDPMGIANLAMATGNVGREGVGVNPLRGNNNVQGSCDMGSFPH